MAARATEATDSSRTSTGGRPNASARDSGNARKSRQAGPQRHRRQPQRQRTGSGQARTGNSGSGCLHRRTAEPAGPDRQRRQRPGRDSPRVFSLGGRGAETRCRRCRGPLPPVCWRSWRGEDSGSGRDRGTRRPTANTQNRSQPQLHGQQGKRLRALPGLRLRPRCSLGFYLHVRDGRAASRPRAGAMASLKTPASKMDERRSRRADRVSSL